MIQRCKEKNYILYQIGNADQMPVYFDMPPHVTVNQKRASGVTMLTSSCEKQRCTAMLAVTAEERKLPPYGFLKERLFRKGSSRRGFMSMCRMKIGWTKVLSRIGHELFGRWGWAHYCSFDPRSCWTAPEAILSTASRKRWQVWRRALLSFPELWHGWCSHLTFTWTNYSRTTSTGCMWNGWQLGSNAWWLQEGLSNCQLSWCVSGCAPPEAWCLLRPLWEVCLQGKYGIFPLCGITFRARLVHDSWSPCWKITFVVNKEQ